MEDGAGQRVEEPLVGDRLVEEPLNDGPGEGALAGDTAEQGAQVEQAPERNSTEPRKLKVFKYEVVDEGDQVFTCMENSCKQALDGEDALGTFVLWSVNHYCVHQESPTVTSHSP